MEVMCAEVSDGEHLGSPFNFRHEHGEIKGKSIVGYKDYPKKMLDC